MLDRVRAKGHLCLNMLSKILIVVCLWGVARDFVVSHIDKG